MSHPAKLQAIRDLIQSNKIDVYIVPHTDAHDSEYIADSDERLAFISNFGGSNGYALISQTEALLWTDSRYFIQAEKQLENPWALKKMGIDDPWHIHVLKNYKPETAIGYDPQLYNYQQVFDYQAKLNEQNIKLVPINENLVDAVWKDKPQESKNPVFIHEEKWHGYPFDQKYQNIWKRLKLITSKKVDLLFTQLLDEIAWTLNLRGSDISHNPLFKSYLLIDFTDVENLSAKRGILYLDQNKLDAGLREYLSNLRIEVKGYNEVFEDLRKIEAQIGIVKNKYKMSIHNSIPAQNQVIIEKESPITYLKSLKNETEIQGFRNCQVRDASALISYFAYLHDQLVNKNNETLDEYSVARLLDQKRSELLYAKGPSFETISSVGPNGAIIHYKPEKETSSVLKPDLLYLCDSGGQYLDGTTDITRTLHFGGTPTAEEINAYTRVLLGNLELQRAVWPKAKNIAGADLDILARKDLWDDKMDYGHGTGHGVGHFMNVHEGPQGISKYNLQPLEIGMTVTDEPGFYLKDKFGIRIEDDLVVVEKGDGFIGFENLTLVPYDSSLINLDLLSNKHIKYINEYHSNILKKVGDVLLEKKDQLAYDWLVRACTPLPLKQ